MSRAASLKKKRELEQRAESLRKEIKQMELNAEIEAAGAEVSVLQTFSAEQDGMESYFEKHQPKQTVDLDTRFKDSTRKKRKKTKQHTCQCQVWKQERKCCLSS